MVSNGAPKIKLWNHTRKTYFLVFVKNFWQAMDEVKKFFLPISKSLGPGGLIHQDAKKPKSLHPTICIPGGSHEIKNSAKTWYPMRARRLRNRLASQPRTLSINSGPDRSAGRPEGVCTDEFLSRKPGFLLSAMHSHAFRWVSAAPLVLLFLGILPLQLNQIWRIFCVMYGEEGGWTLFDCLQKLYLTDMFECLLCYIQLW